MALPTVTKTWQFDVNRNFNGYPKAGIHPNEGSASAGDALYQIKAGLTSFASNPWTVVASCDGVTSATSDLWANYTDVTPGGSRSWVLLRQNQIASNFEMLLESSSSNFYSSWCFVGVCVDGYNTSGLGSPSVRPTANSSRTWQMLIDEGSKTMLGTSQNTSIYSSGRVHVMMDTTGKLTRVVLCREGAATMALLIDVPDDAAVWTPGWTDPVLVIQRGDDSISDMPIYANLNDNTAGYGWFTGSYNNKFSVVMTSEFYNGGCVGQKQTFPDDQSGEWPMCPIGVSSPSVGMRGPRRCTLTDLWWGSTALRTGDCYPENPTPTKEFAQFGDLIFPWNGTTPLVW